MLKPCAYCHSRPRRPNSAYCSDRCAAKKHTWNITHSHKSREYRVKRNEQERIAAAKIYQQEYNALRKVKRLLRETDETPHRLTPLTTVDRLNVVTWKIETVKL